MELSIKDKGGYAPPPVLDQPFQKVAEAVASWPGVVSATHWRLNSPGVVDGVDFYVGEREIGHIHLDGDVHLATDKTLHVAMMKTGKASKFPFGGSYSTWTLIRIRNEADADLATQFIRQNYDRLAPKC